MAVRPLSSGLRVRYGAASQQATTMRPWLRASRRRRKSIVIRLYTPPDNLRYDTTCSPSSGNTWSIAYGTDISNPQTVYTFSATWTGASRYSFSVDNTPETGCRVFNNGLEGECLEYQLSGSLGTVNEDKSLVSQSVKPARASASQAGMPLLTI